MSEEHVVVNLVTGEQLVGKLINETPDGVLLFRPISIKLVPVIADGESVERLITTVYCGMSDQESYIFDARHIVNVNRLHSKMVDHYLDLSDSLYANLKDPEKFKKTDKESSQVTRDNITFH